MKRTTILSQQTVPAVGTLHFTVDNTQKFVPTSNNSPYSIMYAPGNNYKFRAGDNFNLVSYGFHLPLNFCRYPKDTDSYYGPEFKLYAHDIVTNEDINFKEIEPSLNFGMPYEGEIFINQPIDTKVNRLYLNQFYLVGGLNQGVNISMIGVPDVLNGEIFAVQCFIKIDHNFPILGT